MSGTSRTLPALLALSMAMLMTVASRAAGEPLPPDSGVIDVRNFGAKGDGVHDDTVALQAAIDAAQVRARFFWPTRIVYLPKGRYLVRDTLRRKNSAGDYQAQLALAGDGPENTFIVLADRCPGFTEEAAPKAVLFTSSGLRGASATDGGRRYRELGEGNDAYANFVEGLTIDVGRGNPGAVGIDYLSNNFGAVRHIRLRAPSGSGWVGLAMQRRWPGPLLISRVVVEGFKIGMAISHPEYGVTLEHVSLQRQERVALANSANMVAMRDVLFETQGVAILNDDPRGLIVGDGLRFRALGKRAIFAKNAGYLTLRSVSRLDSGGVTSPFEHGGSFFADKPSRGFGPEWKLAAEAHTSDQIPVVEWVSVASFGALPDTQHDASRAIQAALNSGARAVYLPTGRYRIDAPLEVPASVRLIAGMFSVLEVGDRAHFARDQGMLRTRHGGDDLTVARLALDNMEQGAQIGIEHDSTRSMLLRDVACAGASIARREKGGRLFLENVLGVLSVSGPAPVVATQLNIEGRGVLIRNHGTPLSILGLKVEQNATVVENYDGGQTEILGALLYLVFPPDVPRPAFMNFGTGRIFAAYVESAYRPTAVYEMHMTQVDDAHRHTVVAARDLPRRGMARVSPGRTMHGAMQGDASGNR